ncbi:MAG TPA: hypothetical protein VIG33_06085 [Pseudobdellovibrionaceae bacterium]|jgi:hypothetical protein
MDGQMKYVPSIFTRMFSLFIFFYSLQSYAYFVAYLGNLESFSYDRPTHILLSGLGTDLGTLPQLSALGKAARYHSLFPDRQVILISVFENAKNPAALTSQGFEFLARNTFTLNTGTALRRLLKFSRIQSLEIFGHNSPSLGTQTDGPGERFDANYPGLSKLRSRFTADSYASIHGCNSGWLMAPQLSRLWGIPVAGAFTGTRFERLHSDGHFYVYEKGKAPNDNWATKNLVGGSCLAGGCVRMRPMFSPYNGDWGDFSTSPLVNFYKFFCPQNSVEECEKRMALSMLAFVSDKQVSLSHSLEEFKDQVKSFLCPVYANRKITLQCFEALEQSLRGGSKAVHFTVNQKQLSCDLKTCNAQMTCTDDGCVVEQVNAGHPEPAVTMVEEFNHYLNGFLKLQSPEIK